MNEKVTQDLNLLLAAWQLLRRSGSRFGEPANEDDLMEVESRFGPLPEEFNALYRRFDGADPLGGNLLIGRLADSTDNCVARLSDSYEENQWGVAPELMLFAGDGCGDAFGLWLPANREPDYVPCVVKLGAIFEPGNMSVVASGLVPFLLAETVYYGELYGEHEALNLLGVPSALRGDRVEMEEVRVWADPALENPAADPYDDRLDRSAVSRIAEALAAGR